MSQTETNTITITVGEYLFEFSSFQKWVAKAASWFRNSGLRDGHGLCVDSLGRICATGKEMMRARDEGTFPVKVYRKVF